MPFSKKFSPLVTLPYSVHCDFWSLQPQNLKYRITDYTSQRGLLASDFFLIIFTLSIFWFYWQLLPHCPLLPPPPTPNFDQLPAAYKMQICYSWPIKTECASQIIYITYDKSMEELNMSQLILISFHDERNVVSWSRKSPENRFSSDAHYRL